MVGHCTPLSCAQPRQLVNVGSRRPVGHLYEHQVGTRLEITAHPSTIIPSIPSLVSLRHQAWTCSFVEQKSHKHLQGIHAYKWTSTRQ